MELVEARVTRELFERQAFVEAFAEMLESAAHRVIRTVALAKELQTTRIEVNAAGPGYTATALNDFQGTRSVERAAREPVRLALLGLDGPTGTFSNDDGPIPW